MTKTNTLVPTWRDWIGCHATVLRVAWRSEC